MLHFTICLIWRGGVMLRQDFIITLLYQLFLACVFSPIWSQLSRPKHTASCGVWNWHLVGLLGVWVSYIIVIVATKHNPGHTQSYIQDLTVYFKLCLSDWISHINALFDSDTEKQIKLHALVIDGNFETFEQQVTRKIKTVSQFI